MPKSCSQLTFNTKNGIETQIQADEEDSVTNYALKSVLYTIFTWQPFSLRVGSSNAIRLCSGRLISVGNLTNCYHFITFLLISNPEHDSITLSQHLSFPSWPWHQRKMATMWIWPIEFKIETAGAEDPPASLRSAVWEFVGQRAVDWIRINYLGGLKVEQTVIYTTVCLDKWKETYPHIFGGFFVTFFRLYRTHSTEPWPPKPKPQRDFCVRCSPN